MKFTAQGLSKSYGGTAALQNAPLTLLPGRVRALVGENGAGKSTLLKIAGGAVAPDAGHMELDGKDYRPASARAARERGVALIFQELTVAGRLSVAENIFIDRMRDFTRLGLLSRRRLEEAAASVLARLGLGIDPAQPADTLDLGQMKCVELCRAMSTDPAVILLDESTAFMNHSEVDAVIAAMARLAKDGIAVAFVSHHLDEVFRVADDITVLKDGQFVGDFVRQEVNEAKLQALMVGRELADDLYPSRKAPAMAEPPILTITGARVYPNTAPADFALHRGEILGFAGLKSAGGDQIIEALAGVTKLPAGTIRLDGNVLDLTKPTDAWGANIAYLPGDRTGEGLITAFSVLDNGAMATMPRRGPFFDKATATATVSDAAGQLHIKTSSIEAPVDTLSGGNMQKVLLAKCLITGPAVLLLNNPTRGVDMGARQEIYRALGALTDAGGAIILLSEDLHELMGLSDRIVTFRRGAVSRRFEAAETPSENDIVAEII